MLKYNSQHGTEFVRTTLLLYVIIKVIKYENICVIKWWFYHICW